MSLGVDTEEFHPRRRDAAWRAELGDSFEAALSSNGIEPHPPANWVTELGARIGRENARQHRGHGIALGHVYERSPVCCDDGSPPPGDLVRDYMPTARPGARAASPRWWRRG